MRSMHSCEACIHVHVSDAVPRSTPNWARNFLHFSVSLVILCLWSAEYQCTSRDYAETHPDSVSEQPWHPTPTRRVTIASSWTPSPIHWSVSSVPLWPENHNKQLVVERSTARGVWRILLSIHIRPAYHTVSNAQIADLPGLIDLQAPFPTRKVSLKNNKLPVSRAHEL